MSRRTAGFILGLIIVASFGLYLISFNSLGNSPSSNSFSHDITVIPSSSRSIVPEKDGTEANHHLTSAKFKYSPTTTKHLYFPNKAEHTLEGKVKAAIVVLVRNSDLQPLLHTMKKFEEKFNRNYGYPYVFLNNEEFTDEFKKETSAISNSKKLYGKVGSEFWGYPNWVNQTYARECRERMAKDNVIYGGTESYRHMCRFYSGMFFRHPLLKEYDYYWRIEPGVEFYCELDYDPFSYMAKNNKLYGFTISLFEYNNTIPTLWKTTREFMDKHPEFIPIENTLKFIWNEKDGNYNLCHFWSNFEIADLRLWRSERYMKYFDYLDKTGNFYYERWGDAPVHSIAAAMFLHPSQIHFFEDIGYKHPPFTHCPISLQDQVRQKCDCGADEAFDWNGYSCLRWFYYSVKQGMENKYINWKAYPKWAQ